MDRFTDSHNNMQQPSDESVERRLDNWQALIILFTVAMLPSYVQPAELQLNQQNCTSSWLLIFIMLVVVSAGFNWITLSILNRVASVKQMDSFQEVAYNISNSNRGYIFLISAAKFIFLAITAAFSINYSANYLAQLSLLKRDSSEDGPMTSGQIYGVYFAWVIVMGALIFFFYYRLSNNQRWNSLVWFAYIFGGCFIL